MKKIREAVILVGGLGTRLQPVIGEVPKSMLRFNGKPLLEYTLNALKECGIESATLIVNFQAKIIRDYFKDGSKFGMKIDYIFQKNPKGGTSDAVSYGEGKVGGEQFFVIYGDNAFDPKILDGILAKAARYDGVLCGNEMKDVRQYGTFKIEADLVKEIAEKSSNPPSKIVFTGLMILPKEIFDSIRKTPLSSRGEKELTTSITLSANNGKRFGFFVTKEFWMDPRNQEDLEEIEKFYKTLK
jgi:bifunctional UDP-N-acetylglucosamine pyrophosphorylase/glucosamine-1-phosphate N-acetyltransferase